MEENNKKNAVKLSLEDYLRLYEFRKNFENENALVCKTQYSYNAPLSNYPAMSANYYIDKYISESDAIKEILKENGELAERAKTLQEQLNHYQNSSRNLYQEIADLKRELHDKGIALPVETVKVEDIKKMSIWEFLKWRKK
jgi:hypothetical protein